MVVCGLGDAYRIYMPRNGKIITASDVDCDESETFGSAIRTTTKNMIIIGMPEVQSKRLDADSMNSTPNN